MPRLTLPPSWRSVIHLGVFTATRWECTAVRRALTVVEHAQIDGTRGVIGRRAGRRVVLVQSGIGAARAEQSAGRVLARERIDLVVSTGFACALVPARIGDLALATEVMTLEVPGTTAGSVPAAGELQPLASEAASRAGLMVRTGRVVSLSRVLCRGQEKREVARTDAVAADMESAALGRAAARHGLPFMAMRTVSDLLDEDLPLDFNLFLTAGGRLRGIAAALHPEALVGLLRLRRQSRVAANHLTAFMAQFLDVLGECAPPDGDASGRA